MRNSFFIFLLILGSAAAAQTKLPNFPDSLFSTYYHQRVTHFKSLPASEKDIIFLGNSLSDGAEWAELFSDLNVKNRGISGDITAGVLKRLDEVYNGKPAKIFLLIGTNDLARGIKPDSVVNNIFWIADLIKEKSPKTELYVQSIFPVNEEYGKFAGHMGKGDLIRSVNKILKANAPAKKYTFVDLHSSLADRTGRLDSKYTNDGLHLTGSGYERWKNLIYNKIYPVPSLLPLPQKLKWSHEEFLLSECISIVIGSAELKKEALHLQRFLNDLGIRVEITARPTSHPHIELRIADINVPHRKEESYHLAVTNNKVQITAVTPHGVFNGLQTLKQLTSAGEIYGCEITDWPAFALRGYMVDVGRNYQSMPLLLEQIDVMARYKLNAFQFHLTEDIAWRLQVKKYPQLTKPEYMIRNKGKFYSEADIKRLIAYCKERYITFIPEIDMPGHSAAFRRAMGVDMQTDKGLAIVKDILQEFCKTYDIPYLHIGGDEVEIIKKDFLPEAIRYVESLNKKPIGWDPGGNISDSTIRQLWMGNKSPDDKYQYIDSRHLYLNHMDPLESVTTIFHRKIGDRTRSDDNLLGGILCLWHDRNVSHEQDLLTMNPVYPGMLAFAERSWKGGGNDTWITNLHSGDNRITDFADFEERLLTHKKMFFENKPFPYRKQSDLTWKLYGPYPNEGDLSKVFAPEKSDFDFRSPALEVKGGTVVLRHWWAPLVEGVLTSPKENTTWYGVTDFWSDTDTSAYLWAGFDNLSRSPATDSPRSSTWDNRSSQLWLNDRIIDPPVWKNAGKKGNPEVPLVDEGYEYRAPIEIHVRKGWNTLKVKAPVGTFKGTDWQNPVKWMFTAVPFYDLN
jgi:hexosaminidase